MKYIQKFQDESDAFISNVLFGKGLMTYEDPLEVTVQVSYNVYIELVKSLLSSMYPINKDTEICLTKLYNRGVIHHIVKCDEPGHVIRWSVGPPNVTQEYWGLRFDLFGRPLGAKVIPLYREDGEWGPGPRRA